MGIRGHFPSLLLNPKNLFVLAIYETLISVLCKDGTYFLEIFLFYLNTSSLPKTILLALWFSVLKVNKSFNFLHGISGGVFLNSHHFPKTVGETQTP